MAATATPQKMAKDSDSPQDPFAPADWTAHQEGQQRRAAARDKRRHELQDCLDPDIAAEKEAAKDRDNYCVSAKFMRQNDKGKQERIEKEANVRAQSEDDAWAVFCDRIGMWPSRRGSEVEIVKVRDRD